jgi:AcrR family transcriptional regulator
MGTLERREREKRQRRELIVRAARKQFRKNGYDGTTMPAIAAAAELAPGTLYLYFPSKQALYAELLHEGYDVLEQRFREAVAGRAAPRAQAAALIDAFFAFAREAPDTFDVVFFILREPGRELATMREGREAMSRLAARQNDCKRIAAEVLQRARPQLSTDAVDREVDAVWSMLAGVVLYFQRDDPEVFGAVASEARDLILGGVFGRRSK